MVNGDAPLKKTVAAACPIGKLARLDRVKARSDVPDVDHRGPCRRNRPGGQAPHPDAARVEADCMSVVGQSVGKSLRAGGWSRR
jgi:hypothetical protein